MCSDDNGDIQHLNKCHNILNTTPAVGHFVNLHRKWVLMGLDGSMCSNASPWLLSTLTPRACATDLGQGPHVRRGVRACSLRVQEPRAKEQTRGRKRKNADVHNNSILLCYTRLSFGEWDVPGRVTQARMPKEKIINSHPAVLLVA